jgi:hypothetical protein
MHKDSFNAPTNQRTIKRQNSLRDYFGTARGEKNVMIILFDLLLVGDQIR